MAVADDDIAVVDALMRISSRRKRKFRKAAFY